MGGAQESFELVFPDHGVSSSGPGCADKQNGLPYDDFSTDCWLVVSRTCSSFSVHLSLSFWGFPVKAPKEAKKGPWCPVFASFSWGPRTQHSLRGTPAHCESLLVPWHHLSMSLTVQCTIKVGCWLPLDCCEQTAGVGKHSAEHSQLTCLD